jgi:hypothetical protein
MNGPMNGPMSWIEAYAKAMSIKHESIGAVIDALCEDLPSGSGIDNGCHLPDHDYEGSEHDPACLMIRFGYHHMDQNGFYCGWSDYRCTIRATFNGPELRVFGQDRNGLLDHLHEVFYHKLIRRRVYTIGYDGSDWILDDMS